MKKLNLMETQQVSGGLEAVGVLTALSIFNLGLAFYNSSQTKLLKENVALIEELLFDCIGLTIFQEAQLSMLPHYDEVYSLNKAYTILGQ